MSIIHVTGIWQCALIVRDISAALRYYLDLLDVVVIREPAQDWPCAWLRLADGRELHLIERLEPEQLLDDSSVRHVGLAVDDISRVIEEFMRRDLPAFCYDSQGNHQPLDRANADLMGRPSVFLRDPDNNLLKFIQRDT
jgi:catechol 2,3-dioxygenase-like lactoylglutathione lyase family enzyme